MITRERWMSHGLPDELASSNGSRGGVSVVSCAACFALVDYDVIDRHWERAHADLYLYLKDQNKPAEELAQPKRWARTDCGACRMGACDGHLEPTAPVLP